MQSKKHVVTSVMMIAVASIFITILAVGLRLNPKDVPSPLIDKPAKPFQVSLIENPASPPQENSYVSLENLKGKPIVLNFWASWCVSCREEALELEAFWKSHKDSIFVVGIAIQDEAEQAKKFAAYFGKTYILGLDTDGKTSLEYGVYGVPETFLIDKNGTIRHKFTGPVTARQLNDMIPQFAL